MLNARLSFRKLDYLIFGIFIFLIILSVTNLKNQSSSKAVLIISTPEGEFVYPMDKNAVMTFKGNLGVSTVEIEGGKAFFRDSPCVNRICVQMHSVQYNNDWAACIPNGIFIRVEGNPRTGNDIDIGSAQSVNNSDKAEQKWQNQKTQRYINAGNVATRSQDGSDAVLNAANGTLLRKLL